MPAVKAKIAGLEHRVETLKAVVPAGAAAKALAADKALVAEARIFDIYQGPGVPEGFKSVAVEVRVQPRDQTLTEADIEALSDRIVAAAGKATGARLRS
jgi:phenylalanyl-tRNA synthetase beta chain